jgi:hypothetical protein
MYKAGDLRRRGKRPKVKRSCAKSSIYIQWVVVKVNLQVGRPSVNVFGIYTKGYQHDL